MKISLLHHWLVSMRGGEKVLEQFCKLLPKADIHTLVSSPRKGSLSEIIAGHEIKTTLLGKLPRSEQYYKTLLPLFPLAIKSHRVEADFILSSDASLIKGMKKDDHVPHVCYCHSPPRYLWDMQDEYLETMTGFKRYIFEKLTPYLRHFDLYGAQQVDHFIANSEFVRERIKRIYDKDAVIIHPPVDVDAFDFDHPSENFYLVVSALVPYKRVDLAIEAFNRLGKPLVVIGEGPELKRLTQIASDNVKIMGAQFFEVLKNHFEHCKALIFPGVEDFGITPLESQAAGKPVIAYKEGGALETVIEHETGLFFDEQTPEALADAVERFELVQNEFSPQQCRKNAELFRPERFLNQIKAFLTSRYPLFFSDYNWGDK